MVTASNIGGATTAADNVKVVLNERNLFKSILILVK